MPDDTQPQTQPEPLFHPGHRVLARDVLIFQLKLFLDGFKDVLLIQLSLGAAVLDFLFGRPGRPSLFYRVLRMSERFDLWLNLNGAAEHAEASEDGLFGASPAGSPSLLGRLEQMVRRRVEQTGKDPA